MCIFYGDEIVDVLCQISVGIKKPKRVFAKVNSS